MWRLMIADDEPKIRRGLKSQIAHMGLEIEVVAEAEDGEIALQLTEQTRPDILLVDINMPFMSGLDFIERLKQVRTDAYIIVITGFEAFDYARRALDLGVHAYMLKPVELSELRAQLDGAIQKLSEQRERERHFAWALQQLDKRRELLREEFFLGVTQGQLSSGEIEEQLAFLELPPMKRVALLMIRARPEQDAGTIWRPRMLQFAFADALRDVLARCRFSCVFADERDNILVFYDADEAMDEALTQAARQAGAALSVSADVEIQTSVHSFFGLEAAYDQLLEAMQREAARPPQVDQAIQFIRKHFQRPDLGLTDVAEAAQVNPAYLSRLMKQELGMPFSKYLTTVRINAALALMQNGDAKVKDIAARVGYSTPHYFSTAFKKVLGVSPADYRSEDKLK